LCAGCGRVGYPPVESFSAENDEIELKNFELIISRYFELNPIPSDVNAGFSTLQNAADLVPYMNCLNIYPFGWGSGFPSVPLDRKSFLKGPYPNFAQVSGGEICGSLYTKRLHMKPTLTDNSAAIRVSAVRPTRFLNIVIMTRFVRVVGIAATM
jgi:hypothetical protein